MQNEEASAVETMQTLRARWGQKEKGWCLVMFVVLDVTYIVLSLGTNDPVLDLVICSAHLTRTTDSSCRIICGSVHLIKRSVYSHF